jgi:outer membrane protein OmpA-like peptidoglycan-associated protein
MHAPTTRHVVPATLLLLAAFGARADAQGFGDRLRRAAGDAAARTVERRVEDRAERAADAALDGAERGAKSGAKAAAGKDSRAEPGDARRAPQGGGAAGATAGEARPVDAPVPTDAGRDFTPGARVLVATDFRRDEVGDFPRAFRLKSGNAEVADVGGTRYLRTTSIGEFEIPLPETLPPTFTLELDFAGGDGYSQALYFTGEDEAARVEFRPSDGGIVSASDARWVADARGTGEGRPFRVQVMADGDYAKVYLNGARVANVPNAALGRSRAIRVKFRGEADMPTLFGNVRVAAGGRDLYRALAESGRVTADGIYFDTNSDRLRPESEAALGEIAAVLARHPGLRLSIEGHTDDAGDAAANQALSAKRAAAVRARLAAAYGVAGGRLEARGFGAARPAAPNTSEAGRQRNRRVELVRL